MSRKWLSARGLIALKLDTIWSSSMGTVNFNSVQTFKIWIGPKSSPKTWCATALASDLPSRFPAGWDPGIGPSGRSSAKENGEAMDKQYPLKVYSNLSLVDGDISIYHRHKDRITIASATADTMGLVSRKVPPQAFSRQSLQEIPHSDQSRPVDTKEWMCLALQGPRSPLSQLVDEVIPHWLEFALSYYSTRKLVLS